MNDETSSLGACRRRLGMGEGREGVLLGVYG